MTVKHLLIGAVVAVAGFDGLAQAQSPPSASTPTKYALLIGINKYFASMDVPSLTYAEPDVDAMADALRAAGYKVDVLKGSSTTRMTIVSAIQQFVFNTKPEDTFLLYFAGHGVKNTGNGKVYWLATDTSLPLLEASGIRMSHLLDYFADVKARQKILLLDHCLSGEVVFDLSAAMSGGAATAPATSSVPSQPAGPPSASPSRGSEGSIKITNRNVEPIKTTFDRQWSAVPGGTMILAAARDDAFESDTIKHGVFTAALLEAFTTRLADKSGDGQLSASELATFVHDRVPSIAKTMLQPPQIQEVADYQSGSFSSFTLTSTLPLTTGDQAAAESERLKKVVSQWFGKRYVQAEDAALCYAALDRAAEAKVTGVPLDPVDEGIVRVLREVAALATVPERARADVLVQEMRRLRGVQ